MALSSIDISITNNAYKGYIEISSTKQQNVSNNIHYMFISRRIHGFGGDYTRIYEKVITSTSQLTFEDLDITAKSGVVYDYYIELTDGNTAGYNVIEFGTIYNVESWFDGLFIGDYETQYFAPLNCKTETTRNTQSNYVTTLSGRTPYKISNTSLNYTTGQTSALFMPLDQYNQPIKQVSKEYAEAVVDYLTDGKEKILKTSDGRVWYVTIDPEVNIAFDDNYIGAGDISFNWTEINDVPVLRSVTAQ